MELLLEREPSKPSFTHGKLFVDGVFECFTMEDTVRPKGEKVWGQTAIPAGRYKIVLDHSAKFGKVMPHLLDVPGFKGAIRIHSGNTAEHSLGCILVGRIRVPDAISESRLAYSALFAKLEKASNAGEPIHIEVRNA